MTTKAFNLADNLPLVAIIRGVTPSDVVDVAQVLIEEGFTMIEVPLNSPDALVSIKKLVDHFGSDFYIGAGTVTTPELAQQVIDTGANLVVTPNYHQEVVEMSVEAGCVTFPGVVTPTEAFAALAAGATGLKLFPVTVLGTSGFKALKSVLPPDTICLPVGGISPSVDSMKPYMEIGAQGFGLGAALYKPGMTLEQIRGNAKAYIEAFKACY
ncbi:2-dehydro-3-deoxy-6-phosphogalactonate aldolase (plasmid) [Photobacterium sp. DA100]|uniref:2-dehydro-3-deoxy-6-phosphogalactonate aldolase n=1 Tax=Photobacterium sp. DA100 TaxID=3027472 RepID=UPI0024793C11|nr:2-dehydro-3-deoxy-6-phosphogalactonate aldolase [Photobacterium sp. DA100]WEM44487.1 2-dehydro-3-deoxy-6-phosphogalactonate aldolase [Photobacterium sp. DA100]